MSATALLFCYGILVVVASVAGGLVPLLVRLTHQRMQLALSFVAGAMLGVGMLHLLPHASLELGSIDSVMLWAMAGFLGMFFVERFFAFHRHDISEDEAELDSDCTEHRHHEQGHAEHAISAHEITWSGAAVGLSLHGLADGLALAASVQAEAETMITTSLAGLGTFLVIFLHKPFDAMTLGTLLAAGGWTPRARHWVNFLFALLVPLGALLFIFGLDLATSRTELLLGAALAFSAGTFICIASSDLLPELQFHHHDRIKLSAALLLGIGLAWALSFVEGTQHGHESHSHGRAHSVPVGRVPGSAAPPSVLHQHGEHDHDDHDHRP